MLKTPKNCLKALMPIADYIRIPRVQPEVACFLVSNESPSFSHNNPKKFQPQILNTLEVIAENVLISGIPIFFLLYLHNSLIPSVTYFFAPREKIKSQLEVKF